MDILMKITTLHPISLERKQQAFTYFMNNIESLRQHNYEIETVMDDSIPGKKYFIVAVDVTELFGDLA